MTLVEQDDHMRPETTLEILAKLPTVFKKDGVVTAGNASGIVDGAAALVIAGEDAVKARGVKPLGRIVSWATVGVEPTLMGMGPAPAIRKALERAGLTLGDLDLIEINEAFAAQYLACEKELGLDRDKVNVNGGAIAIGHPLGASGARLLLTLLLELRRRGKKYGVASACIGGGQGIAIDRGGSGRRMAIKTVGVLGCGLMGAGIAQVSAAAGFKTIVLEVNEDVLKKGLGRIDKFLTDGVAKGKVTAEQKTTTLGQPDRARRSTPT